MDATSEKKRRTKIDQKESTITHQLAEMAVEFDGGACSSKTESTTNVKCCSPARALLQREEMKKKAMREQQRSAVAVADVNARRRPFLQSMDRPPPKMCEQTEGG